jgi:hypothetical protein
MPAKVDTLVESNRLQHGTSAAEGAFVHHYHATARGNVTGASAAIVCVYVDENRRDPNWTLLLLLVPEAVITATILVRRIGY